MEIIFRAHDGREFDNASDCVAYETAHPVFRMWNSYGETMDFNTALLVEIQGDDDVFITECHDHDVTAEGICGKGIYIWSHDLFEWILLDKDVQNAILKYIGNR